nr:uracil-DNA glycosylase isoform X1 [Rattus norvegicus]
MRRPAPPRRPGWSRMSRPHRPLRRLAPSSSSASRGTRPRRCSGSPPAMCPPASARAGSSSCAGSSGSRTSSRSVGARPASSCSLPFRATLTEAPGDLGYSKGWKLMGFVAEERKHHKVYPPPEQVFTWTQMCDIRDVKVVILGQDPYHGPNQAHGLCFSVQRPVPPPPSLENIFKELSTDIDGFVHPGHGDLSGWARQGVLLLNAVLTVRAHQANSHKERGWEQFTDAVVSWLNQNLNGLVFLLWGSYAQKKGSAIDRKRHHVLQTAHPSPLSVYRGFFGCRHFSKANELLQRSGKKPISWKEL